MTTVLYKTYRYHLNAQKIFSSSISESGEDNYPEYFRWDDPDRLREIQSSSDMGLKKTLQYTFDMANRKDGVNAYINFCFESGT